MLLKGLIFISLPFILLVFVYFQIHRRLIYESIETSSECIDICRIKLVETIPDGLNLSTRNSLSTFEAWTTLLELAQSSLDIASFYWTLRGSDIYNHSSASVGEAVFTKIMEAGLKKNIKIRIAQNYPTDRNFDTELLYKIGAAEVRSVNFTRLIGSGVLHSKLWIVDEKHFYMGSANMDWRSLSQVKELGILMTNCPCLTKDISKIFESYWFLGANCSQIPYKWPKKYATKINLNNPLKINISNKQMFSAYIGSSPPPLISIGRTADLTAIIHTVLSAKHFIYISVMDYIPLTLYNKKQKFWPNIENAIKKAALENKVIVKMLISHWNHSFSAQDNFLHSLSSISNSFLQIDIQVRLFKVPANEEQLKIPFARVNHNKYMVTDNTAYIGTSNWVGDYFIDTAGIGIIMKDFEPDSSFTSNIRNDLVNIFLRDWNSAYAATLNFSKFY